MNLISWSNQRVAVAVVAGALGLMACGSSSSSNATAETTAAKVDKARVEALSRMDEASQVTTDMGAKIPDDVAGSAKCFIVFPSIVKAGFIVGGQGGKGYATCQHGGAWSAPAPISIGGGTLGAQIGGQSTELLAVVRSDKGMTALMSGNFRVGVDASAAAGPVGTGRGSSTAMGEGGDLVSYSKSSGLYAGANLDGTTIKSDEDSTQALYGAKHELKTLLAGTVPPPNDAAVKRFLGIAQTQFGSGRRPVSILMP
jgi:lipid-binding SYLF domain-containing protein